MSRWIDADELLNIVDETALTWEYRRIVSDIRNIIKNAPAINHDDLRPRGRWETSLVEADGVEMYSHFHNDEKCKYFYADHDCVGSPYCPNCGARMEEGINVLCDDQECENEQVGVCPAGGPGGSAL